MYLLTYIFFSFSAWIEIGCLKPYYQFKNSLAFSCKTLLFKEACKAIENYIAENKTAVCNSFFFFLFKILIILLIFF
jgi:hypothetical protein